MEVKCTKCGGAMVEGEIKFDNDNIMPSQMTGIPNSSLQTIYQSSSGRPYWEEYTGRKTGFLFKSDEKKTLRLKGLRCSLCGFIELYAKDDNTG